MTFAEVFISYTAIIRRRNLEMEFKARCMGAITEGESEGPEQEEITPEQHEAMMKAINEQMKAKGMKSHGRI